MKKFKLFIILILTFSVVWLALPGGRIIFAVSDEELTDDIQELILQINDEIQLHKEQIEELKQQSAIYRENIEQKQKEALTLGNQLSVLKNRLHKTQLEIETKMSEIELINAEIKSTELQMGEKETLIKEQKKKVAELIRLIHHYDSKSHLEIILLNKSLSDFFDFLKYSENIQNSLQKVLSDLQIVKQDLEIYRISLGDKRESLEELKSDMERQDVKLKGEQVLKKQLLEETRGAEWKFQNLLAEAQKEWQAAETDIVHLEKTIRQRLAEEDEAGGWISGGTIILSWPVPENKITCYFHEPDYLFRRWIGEHSGADIRAAQGTELKAAASGYVGRAKDAGMGYSYIMIIHSNNIATVYGHVSKIYVKEGDYIKRGEMIGLTGGTPGTPGAGRFVTGPHLHFEVRLNGIPVNPLDYLL